MALLPCQAKGEHSRLVPQELCTPPWWIGRSQTGVCDKDQGSNSLPSLEFQKGGVADKIMGFLWFSSVQSVSSVLSDSLWPHGLQNARPPCLSPTPWVYSNSCPLRGWCYPNISSSIIPFSSHLQSFLASGSFPMSQFFAYQVAKVLGFLLQHQSFQWLFRTNFL